MTPSGKTNDARPPSSRSPAAWQVFALFWAITLLVDRAKRHGFVVENLVTVLAALAVVLFPESLVAFGLLAMSQLFFWVSTGSDQIIWYLSACVHGVFLVVVLEKWMPAASGKMVTLAPFDLLESIRGPLGALLVLGMGMAGFAKLNRDFLDPQLSCGAIYYQWMAESPLLSWLPTIPGAQEMAIWFAVIGECAGPLLLLYSRTRIVGLLLLAAVWFGLSANVRSHYFDFAGLFAALALLWFAPNSLRLASARMALVVRFVAQQTRLKRSSVRLTLRLTLAAAVGLLVLGHGLGMKRNTLLEFYRYGLLLGWAVLLSLCFANTGRLRLSWPAMLTPRPSKLAWLAPLYMLTNEVIVYLGLPHRPSFTMAANFSVSPLGSNHLLVTEVLDLPLSRPVEIVSSRHKAFRSGTYMTWLAFADQMALHPRADVTFRIQGHDKERVIAQDDPRFQETYPLARWLHLDTVRPYAGPIACSKPPPHLTESQWSAEARRLKRIVGQRRSRDAEAREP